MRPGDNVGKMRVVLFSAAVNSEHRDLERRIKARLPDVQSVSRLEDVTKSLPGGGEQREFACILFPLAGNAPQSFDRMIAIATEYRESLFFVFISDDIPASDYKRLVQSGGADWASTRNAPDEIAEILARVERERTSDPAAMPPGTEPVMVAFVPSAGGVGNSTVAIEVGIQLKTAKRTRARRICLLDLDFQNSNICDYLDIEPRMQIGEIAANPDRLDAHLFELFISHHRSGLDVLAAPRNKLASSDVDPEVLEGLFRMIAARYDLILLDLPVAWFGWTRQLLASAEVAFVSGTNTIPGLRQVAETLAMIRTAERVPPRVAVVLNRSEHRLVGGFARRNHVKNFLATEEVFLVREEPETAVNSVNTGIPMAMQGQGKVSKDIAPIAEVAAEAQPIPAAQPRP